MFSYAHFANGNQTPSFRRRALRALELAGRVPWFALLTLRVFFAIFVILLKSSAMVTIAVLDALVSKPSSDTVWVESIAGLVGHEK